MIAIPDFLRHLPVDRRGYPVPVTVYITADGTPAFTVNDEAKRQRLIGERRCPICGHKLPRSMAWVGGPQSAFHEAGCYIDTALHLWCARYALQVCPYLAAPRYVRRIDARGVPPSEDLILEDPTMDPSRPDPFVLVTSTGWDERPFPWGGVQYQRPHRPYRQVEFWRHGQRVEPDAELRRLAAECSR
jgi:hypothetical protein